jgi:carboxypeptidase D
MLLAGASAILSYFVAPPTDLINATGYMGILVQFNEDLTGICELDLNVKRCFGYVDVTDDQQ